MESHEVIVVGGGPAGSTCAWRLRQSGIDVLVLDKAAFPRTKLCAGWITPQVLSDLQMDGFLYFFFFFFSYGGLGGPHIDALLHRWLLGTFHRCTEEPEPELPATEVRYK